jgi:hypothetical protein
MRKGLCFHRSPRNRCRNSSVIRLCSNSVRSFLFLICNSISSVFAPLIEFNSERYAKYSSAAFSACAISIGSSTATTHSSCSIGNRLSARRSILSQRRSLSASTHALGSILISVLVVMAIRPSSHAALYVQRCTHRLPRCYKQRF